MVFAPVTALHCVEGTAVASAALPALVEARSLGVIGPIVLPRPVPPALRRETSKLVASDLIRPRRAVGVFTQGSLVTAATSATLQARIEIGLIAWRSGGVIARLLVRKVPTAAVTRRSLGILDWVESGVTSWRYVNTQLLGVTHSRNKCQARQGREHSDRAHGRLSTCAFQSGWSASPLVPCS